MNETTLKHALLILFKKNKKRTDDDFRYGYNRALSDVLDAIDVVNKVTPSA